MAKSAKKADATIKAADTVTLKVTESYTTVPTVIRLNGKQWKFPLNEEVTAPVEIEAAMAEVSGITFEKVS